MLGMLFPGGCAHPRPVWQLAPAQQIWLTAPQGSQEVAAPPPASPPAAAWQDRLAPQAFAPAAPQQPCPRAPQAVQTPAVQVAPEAVQVLAAPAPPPPAPQQGWVSPPQAAPAAF
jgi:hypothetical protein